MTLTPKQKRVLSFVAAFVRENGYSPSFEEIAAGVGYKSLATVYKHIQALLSKGFIRKSRTYYRSIEIVTESDRENDSLRLDVLAGLVSVDMLDDLIRSRAPLGRPAVPGSDASRDIRKLLDGYIERAKGRMAAA